MGKERLGHIELRIKEHQHREELESSGEHVEDHGKLGRGRETRVVLRRTCKLKSRTDIIDRCRDGSKGSDQSFIVERHDKYRGGEDQEIRVLDTGFLQGIVTGTISFDGDNIKLRIQIRVRNSRKQTRPLDYLYFYYTSKRFFLRTISFVFFEEFQPRVAQSGNSLEKKICGRTERKCISSSLMVNPKMSMFDLILSSCVLFGMIWIPD